MKITINLLPKQYQHQLQNRRTGRSILKNGLMAAIALIVFIVFLYMCLKVIEMQKNIIQAEIQRLETNSIYGKIKKDQTLLRDYQKKAAAIDANLTEKEVYGPLFGKISEIIPDGISIKTVILAGKQVSISGVGKERTQVLEFKAKLEKSGMFSKIDAPLSNFIREKDISFEFKLDLK